ncbi:hypothetical protein AWENTII_005705 [Aspergillus wentii]
MGAFQDSKDLRVVTRLRDLLMAAGLVEVDVKMIPLPLCPWSNGKPGTPNREYSLDMEPDPRMRDIGLANRENIQQLLPALGLYPLTQRLHMPHEQFKDLTDRARREANTPGLKAYFPL